MKLIFATGNEDKMKEIREILSDLPLTILSLKEAGISVSIDENGSSFEENAVIKVKTVAENCSFTEPVIIMSDDSGLEVDAMDKAPGIHSARFMGENTSYHIKNNEIIRRVNEDRDRTRTCRFRCAIAALMPDGEILVSEGTVEGEIGTEERGDNGFGYDPIFFLPDRNLYMAELTPEDKNSFSHRGRALKSMKEKLKDRL